MRALALLLALAGSPDPFSCCVARMVIDMDTRRCVECRAIDGRSGRDCSADPGETTWIECAEECTSPCQARVCDDDGAGWVVSGPLVAAALRDELAVTAGGWRYESVPCEAVLAPMVMPDRAPGWCADRLTVRVAGEQGSFVAVLRWQAGEQGSIRVVAWTITEQTDGAVNAWRLANR